MSRPGEWLKFPVPGSDPLARLEVVIDGRSHPAFREEDTALLRCPTLPAGAYRVQVLAGGRPVSSSAFVVSA